MNNKLYRFTSSEIQDFWKANDHINELLLVKNQEFSTFEELVSKLESITEVVRENYPKFQTRDHPTLDKRSFIYIYEKLDAIYRQEFLTLQNLYLNPQDNNSLTQENESTKRISTLLKYEMTIPRIVKNEHEIETTPNLANLLQVLFHDTKLLDKFLFTWCQKSFGYKIHSTEIIPLNTRILHFTLPFFQNYTAIFDSKGIVTNDILAQIKELLTKSTNLDEKQVHELYNNFELALSKSDIMDRKVLFSKPLALKKEFKNEGAFYELLGYLSLLSYSCNQDDLSRLKALIGLYAFSFGGFCPENKQKYDSGLLSRLENAQPLQNLLQTKFAFSMKKKPLRIHFQKIMWSCWSYSFLCWIRSHK